MWRNFTIGAPTTREGQMDHFFCNNGISHTNCRSKSKKNVEKPAKNLQKKVGFTEFLKWGIPPNRNSQMEGSLQIEIPKTREVYTTIFLQEISSYYQCFSGTGRFTNSKLHRRIFNACSVGQIFDYSSLFAQLQAAPSAGHLLERSLFSGIPVLRDPSIWEFLFWGIPRFRNSGTGIKQTGFLVV